MNKKSFVFLVEWRDILADYPETIRHEVYEAIIEYASSGKIPEMGDLASMAFKFIRHQMDENFQRYENTVAARREAGKKGGAPIGNQNAIKLEETSKNNQKQAKQTKQHDNDHDNDNVYDNDNELSYDNDKKEIVFTDNKEKAIYPYEKIFDLWNSILGDKLPRIKALPAVRKEKIRIRLTEFGNPEEWLPKCEELFRKIGGSRFLCGENNTNWKANFDWLFGSPNNWMKVMEGNYDNMGNKDKDYDLVHFEGEHNPDVYRQMKEELKKLQQ